MANIKSAKKQAKQSEARRIRNLSRKSAIKTAIKKVYVAIERGVAQEEVRNLLRDAQAQLARAKNKRLLHANTVARKVSRLTKYVSHQAK